MAPNNDVALLLLYLRGRLPQRECGDLPRWNLERAGRGRPGGFGHPEHAGRILTRQAARNCSDLFEPLQLLASRCQRTSVPSPVACLALPPACVVKNGPLGRTAWAEITPGRDGQFCFFFFLVRSQLKLQSPKSRSPQKVQNETPREDMGISFSSFPRKRFFHRGVTRAPTIL